MADRATIRRMAAQINTAGGTTGLLARQPETWSRRIEAVSETIR
jgi:hypothetical protein